MKKLDRQLVISTLLCLLPMVLAAALYDRLPDRIPIHFDALGQVDNTWPRAMACFGLPAILAGFNLVAHFMLNTDPRRARASAAMRAFSKWLTPALSVFLQPMLLLIALGVPIRVPTVLSVLVGLVVTIAGNYLPKCRQNYTMGIRLPWTLHSADNWNRTHRLAGVLWVAGGLAFILIGVTGFHAAIALPCLIGLLVVLPAGYSYLLYRRGI
jgi:uncharacterized membrane protein